MRSNAERRVEIRWTYSGSVAHSALKSYLKYNWGKQIASTRSLKVDFKAVQNPLSRRLVDMLYQDMESRLVNLFFERK